MLQGCYMSWRRAGCLRCFGGIGLVLSGARGPRCAPTQHGQHGVHRAPAPTRTRARSMLSMLVERRKWPGFRSSTSVYIGCELLVQPVVACGAVVCVYRRTDGQVGSPRIRTLYNCAHLQIQSRTGVN